MQIKVHREVGKYLRSLEKAQRDLLTHIETAMSDIIADPGRGALLQTPFRTLDVHKYKIVYKGVGYRMIYVCKDQTLYIIHIGTRENVYRDLDPKMIKDFLQ